VHEGEEQRKRFVAWTETQNPDVAREDVERFFYDGAQAVATYVLLHKDRATGQPKRSAVVTFLTLVDAARADTLHGAVWLGRRWFLRPSRPKAVRTAQ
jgi:hypothetical protein